MTLVQLGDITLANFEIPEAINFGGAQMLGVQKLLGGARTVDSFGANDDDIAWGGIFRGITAEYRARYLNNLRANGQKIILKYSQFLYNVVIKDFKAHYKRNGFYIPYEITLTVIEDLTQKINFSVPDSFPAVLDEAIIELLALAEAINNPSLSSALAVLSGLFNQFGDNLSSANTQAVASMLAAVNTAQGISSAAGAALGNKIF